jgi:hypothetical protein
LCYRLDSSEGPPHVTHSIRRGCCLAIGLFRRPAGRGTTGRLVADHPTVPRRRASRVVSAQRQTAWPVAYDIAATCTAAAPAFVPVKLTNYTQDDGVDLTDDDLVGRTAVTFVRGSAQSRRMECQSVPAIRW